MAITSSASWSATPTMSIPMRLEELADDRNLGLQPGGNRLGDAVGLIGRDQVHPPVRTPRPVVGDCEMARPALHDQAPQPLQKPPDRVHVAARPARARPRARRNRRERSGSIRRRGASRRPRLLPGLEEPQPDLADRRIGRHGVPQRSSRTLPTIAVVAACSSSATSGPTKVAPTSVSVARSARALPSRNSRRAEGPHRQPSQGRTRRASTSMPVSRAVASVSPTEATCGSVKTTAGTMSWSATSW